MSCVRKPGEPTIGELDKELRRVKEMPRFRRPDDPFRLTKKIGQQVQDRLDRQRRVHEATEYKAIVTSGGPEDDDESTAGDTKAQESPAVGGDVLSDMFGTGWDS